MLASLKTPRIGRWPAMLSLVAYGLFGVFGHSLHGLLPCADELCDSIAASAEEGCCGHCCHDEPAAAPVEHESEGPAIDARSAGHDPHDCSLCTLLAKIKVGQATFAAAELSVAHAHSTHLYLSSLISAELNLSGAPRGPPAC